MRRAFAWMLLALALCASAQAQSERVTWYRILADDGAALGHASIEVVATGGGREIIETHSIYVREEGGAPTRFTSRTVTRVDATGATVAIVQSARAGHFESGLDIRVEGDRATIVRTTPSGARTEVVALPPGVRFDGGEALLRTWDPAAAPRLEFDAFDTDAMSADRVVIEPTSARGADGRFSALRRTYERGALRGVARLVIDGDGRTLEVEQPMFGSTIRIVATDRETALRRHPPYQVIPNASLPSPYRISAAARRGRIRYRLSFRDDLAFELPNTGEQRAAAEAGAVVLDVCDNCGPGLATDDATLADALRATPWLQSDHPRLRALAAPIAALDVSDARKMELLLERALPFIERYDYNGHYSALDTLDRRAGDCTEAAVLLAALGRAAGIPTRVASGFSYTRGRYHGVSNAFIAHSWTLAYVDGAWRSFDLALLEFDSTHVALTIGDGDPRSIAAASQLASLLRFDNLAEVRPRVGG